MRRLRIATFNIHHGQGLDGITDLRRIAAALKPARPRFVALQELDRGMERSGRVDQPAELSDLLGMEVRFFPTLERDGEYGIAVASADDMDTDFEPLPRGGREEPRGVIIARWRGVTFLATHLSLKAGARRLQTEFLARLAAEADPPVVVVGDLNQSRDTLLPLFEIGLEPGPKQLKTLSRGWRRREFDHVLAGRGARVEANKSYRTRVSDHRPVAALVERR
ncbi:MAG: endonuclease/exonuclease/phosphatase family protein [Actinomycetota bacterium]